MLLRIFNDVSLSAQRSSRKTEEGPGALPDHPTALPPTDPSHIDEESLTLSRHLRTSAQNLEQGVREISHDLELADVIDDYLQKSSEVIIQLRDLASEAATESISATDREAINLEFENLKKSLDQIVETQAPGIQKENNLKEKIDLGSLTETFTGLSREGVATPREALTAMDALEKALDKLSILKTETGSARANLVKALGNLNISIENLSAAEPAARDEAIASELTRYTREQILAQSATALVGQANLIPQGVFELVEEL